MGGSFYEAPQFLRLEFTIKFTYNNCGYAIRRMTFAGISKTIIIQFKSIRV